MSPELTYSHLTFYFQALEKAKEAGRKERMLVRQRDQTPGGTEQINLDLTYSVHIVTMNEIQFVFTIIGFVQSG